MFLLLLLDWHESSRIAITFLLELRHNHIKLKKMNTFSIRSEATSLLFYLLLFCKDRSVAAKFGVDDELSQQRRRRAIINGRVVADPSDAQFFAKTGGDNNKATPDYLCGATFVHNDILLTAAHCQGSFNYGVFLYDPDTNDYTREATVDLQIRYPGFNGVDKHDDILVRTYSRCVGNASWHYYPSSKLTISSTILNYYFTTAATTIRRSGSTDRKDEL